MSMEICAYRDTCLYLHLSVNLPVQVLAGNFCIARSPIGNFIPEILQSLKFYISRA
jgi:hypothetical protein